MAKKKASKKRSSKSKPAKAAASLPQSQDIPKGMKQIGSGYAPSWDVEKMPEIHGKVTGGVREVELTIGRKKQTRRCLEMTNFDPETKITVWESAALGEFFDVVAKQGEGGEYYLRFDGYGKKKPGQKPPKLFTVAAAA